MDYFFRAKGDSGSSSVFQIGYAQNMLKLGKRLISLSKHYYARRLFNDFEEVDC